MNIEELEKRITKLEQKTQTDYRIPILATEFDVNDAIFFHQRIIDRDLSTVTINDDATEQSIYSHEITAGILRATGGVRLTIGGQYLNNAGASRTLTVKIKLGVTAVLTSVGPDITNSVEWREWNLSVLFMNSTVAAQKWTAMFNLSQIGAANFTIQNTATTSGRSAGVGYATSTEDTSDARTLDVTMQHEVAHANLTINKQIAFLELLPPV